MLDRVRRPASKWIYGVIYKLLQVRVGLFWAGGGKVRSVAQEGTSRPSGVAAEESPAQYERAGFSKY